MLVAPIQAGKPSRLVARAVLSAFGASGQEMMHHRSAFGALMSIDQ
jgi:hypothetical protein